MKVKYNFILLTLVSLTMPLAADLKVFSCEPEWRALVKEIGGDKVSAFSATTALQDPHSVQARPSLIAKVRQVDLLICTGAGLEIGWLPLLIRRAANPKIQPGNLGYFLASRHARLLGRPKSIDRSQGDLHSAGNPHIQTSPKNILVVAKALTARMIKLDMSNASYYQQRFDDFSNRWKLALKKWKQLTKPLRGLPIVVHHVSWIYLEDYLKLNRLDVLEDKPGIPPSMGHLSGLLAKMKQNPAKAILVAAYQDDRAALWLSKRTGIPVVNLPFTIGGSEKAQDLFSLYDDTFEKLLKAVSS